MFSNSYSTSGTFNYQGDSHQPCRWTAVLTQRVTAHFTYRPKPIQALSDLDLKLRGALDALGFELNPQIIWNAIPFSFVVDWFTGIGDVLGSLKIDSLELPVELEDGYLQYSELRSVASNLSLDVNSSVSSKNDWPTHATVYKRFERMPILPDYATLRSVDVRQPSLRQAELGFALVAANVGGGSSRINSSNIRSSKTLSAIPFGNISDGLLIR
jgi:hypothetical protein